MREIKFRAWDENYEPACISKDGKPHPTMEYFELGCSAYTPLCDIQVDGDDPNVTLMQYTGLKDKNGVEIYESDQMETNKGILFTIIWSPKSARWAGITPNVYTTKPYVGKYIYKSLPYLAERGIVIGNIYENEELLDPTPDKPQ